MAKNIICNCKSNLGIGNYQSKKNFIEGNGIMVIKNKSRHIKSKFSNVCTKVDSEFWKILNDYKDGIPWPISGQIFAEKEILSQFLTFALANYLIGFLSWMTK